MILSGSGGVPRTRSGRGGVKLGQAVLVACFACPPGGADAEGGSDALEVEHQVPQGSSRGPPTVCGAARLQSPRDLGMAHKPVVRDAIIGR